jgi:chromosome partitioning protein
VRGLSREFVRNFARELVIVFTREGDKRMKTVAIISMKGGCSKTTLATNLAGTLPGKTALIDLDPQGSAVAWATFRTKSGIDPHVSAARCTGQELGAMVDKARRNGVDWLVIDTSPRSDADVLAAAKHADLILTPTLVGIFDVKAVKVTLGLLDGFQVPKFVVLSKVRHWLFGFGQRAGRAAEAVKRYGGTLADVSLPDAVTFEEAAAGGKTAYEYDGRSNAGRQILALRDFAIASVGAQHA